MSEQLLLQILHKLDHIESEQQSMKSDILEFKESQSLMSIQLQEANEIVRAIRDRQKETDAKPNPVSVDVLSMDVNKLHGEVASIRTKQERLEIIVKKLSARSLEQESEIHSIRLEK